MRSWCFAILSFSHPFLDFAVCNTRGGFIRQSDKFSERIKIFLHFFCSVPGTGSFSFSISFSVPMLLQILQKHCAEKGLEKRGGVRGRKNNLFSKFSLPGSSNLIYRPLSGTKPFFYLSCSKCHWSAACQNHSSASRGRNLFGQRHAWSPWYFNIPRQWSALKVFQ